MEPDIAIGLIYYAMERNFPTSPANQEIREALTIKNVSIPGSTTLEWNVQNARFYKGTARIET